MCSLKSEDIPHMKKREIVFFLKTPHFLQILDSYLFIRPENLKTSAGPYLQN